MFIYTFYLKTKYLNILVTVYLCVPNDPIKIKILFLGPWKFSSDLIHLPAFSSFGVHSAFDRTASQEISLEVKSNRRVNLTALPSWLCRLSK